MINNYLKTNDVNHRVSETIGCIRIGDNVFIGSGTRILGNVNIGSNVIIGASALVNKDIPDNSVVAGVPARVISSFDDYINKRLANNTVTSFGGGG
jgi:serine acetyltransferase